VACRGTGVVNVHNADMVMYSLLKRSQPGLFLKKLQHVHAEEILLMHLSNNPELDNTHLYVFFCFNSVTCFLTQPMHAVMPGRLVLFGASSKYVH
jgi:hypothetical protein